MRNSVMELITNMFLNASVLQEANLKNPNHVIFVSPNDKVAVQLEVQMTQNTNSQ